MAITLAKVKAYCDQLSDEQHDEIVRNASKTIQEVAAELYPEKRHKSALLPTLLDPIIHKNDHVTQHIERSIMDRKAYKVDRKANQLVHQHGFETAKHKQGEMKLIVEGLAEQAHESITVALDSLGDACRDTFVAITGLFVEMHGPITTDRSFLVSIDEILAACGKQKSHGAYKKEQRAKIIKHLKTLSQSRIRFYMPTTKKVKRGRKWVVEDTEIVVEGPIMTHNGRIGEYLKITGEELWEYQEIVLGPWARFIGSRPTMTTKALPQQVLAYDPNNEPYHKRLGHYIHMLFRNNAERSKCMIPHGITIEALFEGACIEPERNRGRFKDEIDRALKHLKTDGVIGNYWYMTEKTKPELLEKVTTRQGRWFDAYLKMYINFSSTQETLDRYKNIAKKEGKNDEE